MTSAASERSQADNISKSVDNKNKRDKFMTIFLCSLKVGITRLSFLIRSFLSGKWAALSKSGTAFGAELIGFLQSNAAFRTESG